MLFRKYTEEKAPNDALDVTEITLLSIEEYEFAKDHIPLLDEWWWLRSPGRNSDTAADVWDDGWVDTPGSDVINRYGVVRPALRVSNLEPLKLQIGDKIIDFAGYNWTVVAKDLILCDDSIGCSCFRQDWQAKDANNFDASDVKKYLEDWAQSNRIVTAPDDQGR